MACCEPCGGWPGGGQVARQASTWGQLLLTVRTRRQGLLQQRTGAVTVGLLEMKPLRRSPAHQTDRLAELVCSNSFRSDNPESAIGMLHAELRQAGSLILQAADASRVPAGDALAVDREQFADRVTTSL